MWIARHLGALEVPLVAGTWLLLFVAVPLICRWAPDRAARSGA